MICYKDRTFCRSDCTNNTCFRFFSAKDHENATKWWGNEDYPLAVADFSSKCEAYIQPQGAT